MHFAFSHWISELFNGFQGFIVGLHTLFWADLRIVQLRFLIWNLERRENPLSAKSTDKPLNIINRNANVLKFIT